MEVPSEPGAFADEEVQEFVRRDGLDIFAGVADRRTEDDAVLAQQVHGMHDPVEDAWAAAAVIDFAETFDAEGEAQIADFDDFLAEIVVDEGAVRKGVEFAVIVLLAEADDIPFAHQRFAAREQVEMAAQFFAFCDEFIHDVKGKVQGVTVFGGPAADAVQVAGTRRVEKDGPGDVAVILFFGCIAGAQAVEGRFEAEVHDGRLDDVRVERIQPVIEEAEPFAAFIDQPAGFVEGFFFKEVPEEVLHDVG